MNLIQSMVKEIKYLYKTMCIPPFSEDEIQDIVHSRNLRDELKWEDCVCKEGVSSFKYTDLTNQGYVLSKVSCGNKKGELCLYNRKTDKTIFPSDCVIKEEV